MIRETHTKAERQDTAVSIWSDNGAPLDKGNIHQTDEAITKEDETKIFIDVETFPSKQLNMDTNRICDCKPNNLNCLTAKEWIKCQLGVWEFNYEKRDIRDKSKHPATFPISLARRCIELFSHRGELVVDPFMGSGTTLLAARDANRNAVGFDINTGYITLTEERLNQETLFSETKQLPILDDARHISQYLPKESITCIVTSPPYANLLNRERRNKSRRGIERKNEQYMKVEQYSQQEEDLGTLNLEDYSKAIAEIFEGILPLMKKKGHIVINVPDMWWENTRVTIHVSVIEAMRSVGYELRNTIIWNRLNIVNNVGIFGWPSNYITMGTTFEYLLDFWRPENILVAVDSYQALNVPKIEEQPITDDIVLVPDDKTADMLDTTLLKTPAPLSKSTSKTKGSSKRGRPSKKQEAIKQTCLDEFKKTSDEQ